MEKLIKTKIKSIKVFGDYHDNIHFKTDKGNIYFHVEGECCSSSFFSEIWNPQNVIGQDIISVEDIELEAGEAPKKNFEKHSDPECESVYGIKITSDKGSCVIIFRNHSNGYYGGYVTEGRPPEEDSPEWIIENDWSAPSL